MFQAILDDINYCIRLRRVILFFAVSDLKARYRRTILGPFWIVIGLALGSLGLGFLWSELWGIPKEEIIPPITIGFLVWILINGSVLESTTCLIDQANSIQNMRLPITFYPMLTLIKQLINFAHSLIIVLLISLVYPPENLYLISLAIPGIFVTVVFLFSLISIMSICCARYRDIGPLVSAVMPMLFFLSPVLFRISQADNLAWLIWMNPFTYFIVIVREPMQGAAPDMEVFVQAVFIALASLVTLAVLLWKKSKQIVYWV